MDASSRHRFDFVFLDRDGTVNAKAPEGDYIKCASEFRMLPGAAEGVAQINKLAAHVVIVTNQRGVALGRMTVADLGEIHAAMERELAEHGAHVDAVYFCPHDLGECSCRKPHTGLLHRAVVEHGPIDKSRSWMIGDSASDVAAGTGFGLPTILLSPDAMTARTARECEPNRVCSSLRGAALLLADSNELLDRRR